MLAWTLKDIPGGEARQKVLDGMLVELTREAQDMEPSEDGVVALDWMNGRRTPDADQNVKVPLRDSHWNQRPGNIPCAGGSHRLRFPPYCGAYEGPGAAH